MKKIIAILLTVVFAVSVFTGCMGSSSNITPLTPVFANGVSPDYSGDVQNTPQDSTPADDPVEPENNIPEGYALYEDAYVSFNYPKGMKKIDYYLRDTASGAEIIVSPQAVKADEYDYSKNIYSDLNDENYVEMCSEYIAFPEDVRDFRYYSTTKDTYEVTVVKYYGVDDQYLQPEGDGEATAYRNGYAYIYIENSAYPEFSEIVLSVSADEYPAGYLPKNYINFSDIVDQLVESLAVVNAE